MLPHSNVVTDTELTSKMLFFDVLLLLVELNTIT